MSPARLWILDDRPDLAAPIAARAVGLGGVATVVSTWAAFEEQVAAVDANVAIAPDAFVADYRLGFAHRDGVDALERVLARRWGAFVRCRLLTEGAIDDRLKQRFDSLPAGVRLLSRDVLMAGPALAQLLADPPADEHDKLVEAAARKLGIAVNDYTRPIIVAIGRVARRGLHLALTGEPGTGKTLSARLYHEVRQHYFGGGQVLPYVKRQGYGIDPGPRGDSNVVKGNFEGREEGFFHAEAVAVAGLFGLAGRGTLVVDEIGGDRSSTFYDQLMFAANEMPEDREYVRDGERTPRLVQCALVVCTAQSLEDDYRASRGWTVLPDGFERRFQWVHVDPLSKHPAAALDFVSLAVERSMRARGTSPMTPSISEPARASLASFHWKAEHGYDANAAAAAKLGTELGNIAVDEGLVRPGGWVVDMDLLLRAARDARLADLAAFLEAPAPGDDPDDDRDGDPPPPPPRRTSAAELVIPLGELRLDLADQPRLRWFCGNKEVATTFADFAAKGKGEGVLFPHVEDFLRQVDLAGLHDGARVQALVDGVFGNDDRLRQMLVRKVARAALDVRDRWREDEKRKAALGRGRSSDDAPSPSRARGAND